VQGARHRQAQTDTPCTLRAIPMPSASSPPLDTILAITTRAEAIKRALGLSSCRHRGAIRAITLDVIQHYNIYSYSIVDNEFCILYPISTVRRELALVDWLGSPRLCAVEAWSCALVACLPWRSMGLPWSAGMLTPQHERRGGQHQTWRFVVAPGRQWARSSQANV
jgi:hypothetical protein